jgi:hypothetical protein
VTRISAAHAAACMGAGDGEEWIRSMELDPMDEPVDAAAWMAAEVCACECVCVCVCVCVELDPID